MMNHDFTPNPEAEALQHRIDNAIRTFRAISDEGVCRSCKSPVWWVVTKTGRKMPISQETLASHFADCPNANAHRKSKP